ncbi:hypothetical protein D3C71_2168650 [compost metagenome]
MEGERVEPDGNHILAVADNTGYIELMGHEHVVRPADFQSVHIDRSKRVQPLEHQLMPLFAV